ncbi:hypothetical protein [Streptomyces sp. NPDC049879]|uniref:hypothetical protein n=1 Tax=Streptomyces sp. NPDC049879 TaxID=3365598 RepID=UPI0037B515DA
MNDADAPDSPVGTAQLVAAWRGILDAPDKSWALFAHGTCVVLVRPEEDLARQAVRILGEFGPVHAGSPAGDFGVISLGEGRGWVITGHHPDVLTYVAPDDAAAGPDGSDLGIGLHGRSLRDLDGTRLRLIHVEDNRPTPGA